MKWSLNDLTRARRQQLRAALEHEAVWLEENIFRAGQKGVDDAVSAIKKIHANAKELNEAAEELRAKYN